MSKLSRSSLKSIVKECLVEILSEGLASSNNSDIIGHSNLRESRSTTMRSQGATSSSSHGRSKTLDNISFAKKAPSPERSFDRKISNVTKSMTSDPVLSNILMDTAKTTLQEQISADNKRRPMPAGRSDAATRKMNNSDPADIFGSESAGKWAQLAFSPGIAHRK